MAVIQPEGALRTIFTGDVTDALFSADGARVFVVSGQSILAIDRASGQVAKDYALGERLGAFDLSADGRYLVVVADPLFNTETSADFFRIDLSNHQVKEYALPLTGNVQKAFRDVAFLADGTALFTQRDATAAVIQYRFSDDTVLPSVSSVASGTLVASPDHNYVLVQDSSAFRITQIFQSAQGLVASMAQIEDPYAGASVPSPLIPVGAISPSGGLFVQGTGLRVSDAVLNPLLMSIQSISPFYANGMIFSPSGSTLYLAQGEKIVALDATSWQATAVYPAGGQVSSYDSLDGSGFGNILRISPDGRYLSVIETDGLKIIDLQAVLPVATSGNDIITDGFDQYGLGGNDTLGAAGPQYMYGGAGNDIYYVDSLGDRVFERAGEGYDRVYTSVNFFIEGVEEVHYVGDGGVMIFGDAFDNQVVTGDGDDEVSGNDGNDTIITNGGNDKLDGGLGADDLRGGQGDDIYIVDNAEDLVIELVGAGTDEVRTELDTYTLADNVEIITGISYSAQTLNGNGAANVLRSSDRNNLADTLAGKGGDDVYHIGFNDMVVELAAQGRDTVHTGFNYVLPDNVEDLVLEGASEGTGNALDNRITAAGFSANVLLQGLGGNDELIGGEGDDTLDGGSGADTMSGGKGDDVYIVDSVDDILTEEAGEGFDAVEASVNYTLAANFEYLTLTGTATDATGNAAGNGLFGNELNNVLRGLGGADWLYGGAGDDRMLGGRGSDLYSVDSLGDTVVENAGQGNDEVLSSVSFTLGINVERLTLTGGDNLNGTGNSRNNVIFGNSGQNELRGLAGNDVLVGGDGDLIDGGDGEDIAALSGYSTGVNEGFTVTGQADDFVLTSASIGTVRMVDVEIVSFFDADYAWDDAAGGLVQIAGANSFWRAVLSDDFRGSIGTGGVVQGTLGLQDITVLDQAGSVWFDPSFNRGGDIIRFTGNAEDWAGVLSGSAAQLSNGFTSVTIPAGAAGATLVFADGARTLRFVDGEIRVGEHALTTDLEFLTGASSGPIPAYAGNDDAVGRLFLPASTHVMVDGNFKVYGTVGGKEHLTVLGGEILLDPSFNRGGDKLVLPGDAADYTAVVLGASAILHSANGDLTIPIGAIGTTLEFDDGDRLLRVDMAQASVTIGSQPIAFTPVVLTDFG